MFKKLAGQVPTVVIAAATAAIFGGGGAYAAAQITSAQIADQTIQSRDIGSQGVGTDEVRNQTLASGDIAEEGVGASEIRNNSITGADINDSTEKNLKGKPLAGAIYRTANYPNGGGGYVTVSCADDAEVSQQYVAVSGGIYQGNLDSDGKFIDGEYASVAQSFAGRMDWATNTPKEGRLDGWVIKLNGQSAKAAADGGKLQAYALCVKADVEKQSNNY